VVATTVGTPGPDRLKGTAGRDIIAGLGGNDIILGLGGNDVLCGGPGHDRLFGGPGRDKLLGQTGRDKLRGGTARDRLFGGAHADRLFGQGGPDLLLGGPGNDRLVGGTGIDTCYQNSGQGAVLQCELPAAVPTGPAPTPPPPPEPKTLAIAYSDLVRDYQFGSGDVLIAKLVDANFDGVPSTDDTILMGMYPTTANPTSPAQYLPWGVTHHVVETVDNKAPEFIVVTSTTGGTHTWTKTLGSYRDQYDEESAIGASEVDDWPDDLGDDSVLLDQSSPSEPTTNDFLTHPSSGDDKLVDVDLYFTP